MDRSERYWRLLASAKNAKALEAVLKEHSGLPGPRGNLELAHVFARAGQPAVIWRLARLEPKDAPENTPEGYLAFCGVLGLGRLVIDGDAAAERMLIKRASDTRWRVREGVATGIQLIGDVDRLRFTRMVTTLAGGNALEQRAAVAAVAEPRLLKGEAVTVALRLLDDVTRGLERSNKPLGDAEKVLRQALGYAWSVVVAADPGQGKPAMERWLGSGDPDIGWVMRENLKKKRLQKADPSWCARWGLRRRG